MDNLKFCVVITTNENSISTEPPGAVEGYTCNLFWNRLAHSANFICQILCYGLPRKYDSELKFHKMRKYQIE